MTTELRYSPKGKVGIVGAGVLGLLALKNLREQGVDAISFSRDEYVGGLWHVSGDREKTTAMKQTTMNTSKHTSSFSDFPMPDEFATHPTSTQLNDYLVSYAKHFDLIPHIRFSTKILNVKRSDDDKEWLVTSEDVKSGQVKVLHFDKVVLATGILNTPNDIKIKGQQRFSGELIHSRQFKDPSSYKGKNVMVAGVGATGVDTLVFLKQAGVGKLYNSHREQYWVLPRMVDGKAFDHSMSRRVANAVRFIASCSTGLCTTLMAKGLGAAQFKAFPWLKKHPSFSPDRKLPSAPARVPAFSDFLPEYLRDGGIETVYGIDEIIGPNSVRLADGKVVDNLDAIIMCTGYRYDQSILEGKGDPTDPAFAPDGYSKLKATPYHDDRLFPRLYRGFLSEQYPESLAILGQGLIPKPPFVLYDLITMSLGSLWSGSYPLPTKEDMQQDIGRHYDFIVSALNHSRVPYWGFRVDSRDTYAWLNDAAGTGVNERLGAWSVEGWKFWWNGGKLYSLIMNGVDCPAVYRLFDTGRGRKPWSGASAHIEKINKEVNEMGEAWKREQADKKKK